MHRDFHFLSMHIRNHCKEIKITVTRLSGMSTVMVTTKKNPATPYHYSNYNLPGIVVIYKAKINLKLK